MLVFDIPQKMPSQFTHIDIPLYHRVHLALAQDVDVHACLLASLSPPHLPELVISPFDFSRWERIWRLNASLLDRVGLLHDVCDTLRRNGANILAAESSMMEEQNVYHLELILEIQDEKKLELIEWSLKVKFFKDLTFHPSGNPRLQFRRLQNLYLAKQAYEQQHMMRDNFVPVNETLSPRDRPSQPESFDKQHPKKSRPRAFRLTLPKSIRDILNEEILPRAGDHECLYLRLSDTKDRFLRVLFFRATDPVTQVRLEYDDRVGAAASVTKAMRDSGFNILAAYLSPAEGRNRARMEAVVRCARLKRSTTEKLRRKLENAFTSSPAREDLKIDLGYPQDYGSRWEPVRLSPVSEARPGKEVQEGNWIEALKGTLDTHYEELSRKLRRGDVDAERLDRDHWGWTVVNELRDQYYRWWPMLQVSSITKDLFVSCHYRGDQLKIVKRLAKRKGFHVFTGEDLVNDPNIRDGLMRKISCCTHFLGVWSWEGAQRFENAYWPSPWLHWEFGVAQAFGLVWRLLVSENISRLSWEKIAPDVQCLLFDHDFETKVRRILDILSTKPAQRPPTPIRTRLGSYDSMNSPFLEG